MDFTMKDLKAKGFLVNEQVIAKLADARPQS